LPRRLDVERGVDDDDRREPAGSGVPVLPRVDGRRPERAGLIALHDPLAGLGEHDEALEIEQMLHRMHLLAGELEGDGVVVLERERRREVPRYWPMRDVQIFSGSSFEFAKSRRCW
jgi:hypothetical protein